MASSLPANSDYSQWPVIVHKELINSPISHLLLQKKLKFRMELTNQVLDELLSSGSDQSSQSDQCSTLARIDKLGCFHGHSFVLLLAPLFTSREFRAVSELQVKYLGDKVNFLPCHNAEEAVTAMLTVADLQTPPKSDILHQRFHQLMVTLLKPAPSVTTN